MPSRRVITEEDIEDGLSVVARLIDRYGDVYWPVFERLERELENRHEKRRRIQAHLKSGKPDTPQTLT
jgi:hypothetical protein